MAALLHAAAPSAALSDLKSVADCDETLDALTAFITESERRLSAVARRSTNEPAGWRASLTAELRIAKLTLPRLQERRADLKREARQAEHLAGLSALRGVLDRRCRVLVSVAWEAEPQAMQRVEAIARGRHPELFTDGGAA